MEDYIIVSFSGGKDSTAMLLRMLELNEPINEVIFCDTGIEFPAMYSHIEKVKAIVEKHDILFTTLKPPNTYEYYMFNYVRTKRTGEKQVGLGWAMPRCRWCNGYLKRDVIKRYYSNLKKQYNIIECVGLAADEQKRLERPNNKEKTKRFPLVEWGWTESQCLEYCYSLGFDWGGLYQHFKRVSCWCCPLQSLEGLRNLRKYYPELWQQPQEWDNRSPNNFRADYTVEELETRFQFEDNWIAANKGSTRTRAFYAELKKLIEEQRSKA